MNTLPSPSALLLGLALAPSLLHAQGVPDAGRVLRELPPLREAQRGTGGVQAPPSPAAAPAPAAGQSVVIREVRVVGQTVFSAQSLLARVADVPGQPRALAQLQAAAARITAHYRGAGYFVARAYLPQQALDDGVLTIVVMEGELSAVQVDNASNARHGPALAALTALPIARPAQQGELDRAVLDMADTPGVGKVDARLRPGDKLGQTVLVARLDPAPLWTGQVEADNHGSRYTGRNRLSLAADASSALGWGERFSARLLASNGDLVNGRASAQAPVSGRGTTLGGAWARTRYALGDSYVALDAVGRTDTVELSLRHPWLRSLAANVSTQLMVERRSLRDEVRSTQTLTDKRAHVGTLSLQADARDGWGGGGGSAGQLALTAGQLDIDSPSAQALDAVGAQTAGSYSKWAWRVERQQSLASGLSLRAQARGQWAGDNLDSSEKFSLGGAGGVRAYASGEATGDRGWLTTVELRYAVTSAVSAALFHDVGRVTVNARPYLAGPGHLLRRGTGLGVNAAWGSLELRAVAAWRGHEIGTAEPDSRARYGVHGLWRF